MKQFMLLAGGTSPLFEYEEYVNGLYACFYIQLHVQCSRSFPAPTEFCMPFYVHSYIYLDSGNQLSLRSPCHHI